MPLLFISTFGNPHSLVHSWFNFFEDYVISRLRIFLILYAFYVFLYFYISHKYMNIYILVNCILVFTD